MNRLVACLVASGLAWTTAHADPELARALTHEPPPTHLRMRPHRATAAAQPPVVVHTPMPAAPPPAPEEGDAVAVRDVREPVSVAFNLGYAVDGTSLSGRPDLGGYTPQTQQPGFQLARAYGFGDGYFSSRGVGLPSLSTYFSAQFQLVDRQLLQLASPGAPSNVVAVAPPIATWFDRSGVEVHSGWAELSNFLGDPAFAPLRVRAGELYVYGPWVLHLYGATAAWDGRLLHASVYAGSRVPDYSLATATSDEDRAAVGGANLHVDLRGLSEPVPLTAGVEFLDFQQVIHNAGTSSHDTQLDVDWRPNQHLAVLGDARSVDDKLASEHLQIRVRYHEVTSIVVDVTHHNSDDWRWDPSLVGTETQDPLAPRRYLDLGPMQPELLVSARAGTLIAENVDLYGRFAASANLESDPTQVSSFLASYVEGGGALEVRVRRTVSIGVSGVTRATPRQASLVQQIPDDGTAQPPPSSAAMGERGFSELGVTARMTLGSRKFSATAEAYGRYTVYADDYCVPGLCGDSQTGVRTTDTREGGRFSLDAWIGKNVRLFASYELSSSIAFQPEITGYKSIKFAIEGRY
jgi:hypothetical protein